LWSEQLRPAVGDVVPEFAHHLEHFGMNPVRRRGAGRSGGVAPVGCLFKQGLVLSTDAIFAAQR